MPQKVSDFIVQRLRDWGVSRIYGYPGDGINGVMGALNRAREHMEFIQVPHEELASFMACAHAKYTGEVGVCISTSGPGGIHMLNGLYDAKLDHQPVVAIVGQQARMSLGGHFQQEIDLISLYKDVASEFVQMATSPEQVRHLIDRAIRIAKAERTVTCVILPHDLQDLDAVTEPPHEHGALHSSVGMTSPEVVPTARDLQQAADVLNAGKKVAILVGAGALHATDEVIQIAETLGAGVAKSLLGKAALPDDLPFVTGSVGWLGTQASYDMMAQCDTLLMIGTNNPYSEALPQEGQARGVQIDIDGRMLGLRYPMEVNLIGDSAATLRALLPLLQQQTDRSWRQQIEQSVAAWWQTAEQRAMQPATPINPQRVFWELSSRLPDNSIISGDCGTVAVWMARDLKARRGMQISLSGTLATMGSGVPYAIAAKFAYPDRPSIALVGDGAMQMLGNNGLITIAKYWQQWQDPRLIILVLNNRDLNFVTWEQRVMEDDPKFSGAQDLLDFPFARYADMLGLIGIRVDNPDEIGNAWDEALSADRPVVLEAMTDANVPTLPPQLTPKQKQALNTALQHGDPDAQAVIAQSQSEGIAIA